MSSLLIGERGSNKTLNSFQIGKRGSRCTAHHLNSLAIFLESEVRFKNSLKKIQRAKFSLLSAVGAQFKCVKFNDSLRSFHGSKFRR